MAKLHLETHRLMNKYQEWYDGYVDANDDMPERHEIERWWMENVNEAILSVLKK